MLLCYLCFALVPPLAVSSLRVPFNQVHKSSSSSHQAQYTALVNPEACAKGESCVSGSMLAAMDPVNPAEVRMLRSRDSEAVLVMPPDMAPTTSQQPGTIPSPSTPSMQPVVLAPPSTNEVYPSPSVSDASSSATATSSVGSLTPTAFASPSSSSTLPSPTESPSAPMQSPIMAAYYPDWCADSLPPEAVDFDRFDWMDFAFAIPDGVAGLKFTQNNSEQLLDRLVRAAHSKGKHVKLSIGGWDDSNDMSTIMASPTSQQTFVENIAAMYHEHNLDGIDIDWEYPGAQGAPGNQVSPQDTSNFLSFLQLLRACLPSDARISAACQDWPFTGSNGMPIPDASGFAKVLDWILLMNYDVWQSSSSPGPNAPLNNGCGNSSQPSANAQAGITAWETAKFPANKILLGIPSYGYSSQSNVTHLMDRSIERDIPSNISLVVKNDDDGTSGNGQVQFVSLVRQGALQKDASGLYVGGGGFQRNWDACSSTPFLRSPYANQIITYDDPFSIQMKAALANQKGLLGLNMFDAHGDTPQWELVDAARRGLGIIQG